MPMTARLTLDDSETRQALVLLATDLIFFFLAVQLFGGGRSSSLQAFGMVVLIFAGCMGLFAILQSASGAHRIYGIAETPNGAMFAPYVNRDHFAGLMDMLLPVAIFYIAGRHGRLSLEGSAWRVFGVAMALAALLLSGSRTGLLALAAETAGVDFHVQFRVAGGEQPPKIDGDCAGRRRDVRLTAAFHLLIAAAAELAASTTTLSQGERFRLRIALPQYAHLPVQVNNRRWISRRVCGRVQPEVFCCAISPTSEKHAPT